METRRLFRSNRDAMIGGVAGGLAEYFNIDPTLVRLLFVLIAFTTAGIPVLPLYLILWIVIPRNPNPAV
jgi:phage shock protein C